MKKEIMDGNTACSRVAYNFIEAACIYPITPASTMAELADSFSASGVCNMFSDKVKVIEMQSEAGAIASVHGMLQNGILATTYTASQGLLLMIPNMYKIAGELLPCVINVAARTIATHALSIMGDHSDIYAVRSTGFAIFASSSPQQVMDLTCIPYLSTLTGHVPFVNFFDGFRTSHEYNKIDVVDNKIYKKLLDKKALNEFRNKGLNVDNPKTFGTNQGDNIYFQAVESRNKYYDELPDVVNSYMEKLNKEIGTNYKPFNYYGDKNATKVIVAMGSVCETIKEVIDTKKKVGLIEVHLYRPFSSKYFLDVLPKSVKQVAVLDRTKEQGSFGPLYLDVSNVINKNRKNISVYGGIYGLSSKNTTPNDIEAVYNFLDKKPFDNFTLGIIDDVTNKSLERTKTKFNNGHDEILIYGYGSDGMVTTSKDILTIIGDNTEKYVQGYFYYDSKKSGGVTKCHLRFSDNKIRSTYYVENPRVVVVTKDTYLKKYDCLKGIKDEGIFILNTEKQQEELKDIIPKEMVEELKKNNIKFYIINASEIARRNNIPNKISMIMEAVIIKLSNIYDLEKCKTDIIERIKKNFTRKGIDVVNDNINALNEALDSLTLVDLSKLVSNLKKDEEKKTVFSMMEHLNGDNIPVSKLLKYSDGNFDPGTSSLEKRGISNIVPSYDKNKCIMCNMCSFVCPHAVIRPYLLSLEEANAAPDYIKETLKDTTINNENYKFTVCMSPLDCTGCSLCTSVCPTKAITMEKIKIEEQKRFDYLEKHVTEKHVLNKETIKGSQFVKPKFSFSGACAGCGETTYLKLLSQLFEDNLIIANATGCSSIYGASLPSTPYTVPWANSLFEDNAEFGYGIRLSEDFMKDKIKRIFIENKDKVNSHNKKLIDKYLNSYSKEVSFEVYENLDYKDFKEIEPLKKFIKEKSIWAVGGDGWAYDIGYGGIDHILANHSNINILVLDTEVYSNTGGQASKSTRSGAIAKFACDGKKEEKKDLAKIALCYPHVYVATISLGANYMQAIKALTEANNYDGPSIIIAYAPCIAHGIKSGMKDSLKEEKLATDSGYFPLFRRDPRNNKLTLDSKADFTKYEEIFERENRYVMSKDKNLLEQNKKTSENRFNDLKDLIEKG